MGIYFRAHFNPVWATILILVLIGWLIVLYKRLRSRQTKGQSVLLLLPKVLTVILLIVACFDPVWSVLRPADKNKKISVFVDDSSSMDTRDMNGQSRWQRAMAINNGLINELGSYIKFDTYEFDSKVHKVYKVHRDNRTDSSGVRGTDLGGCLLDMAKKAKTADDMCAILLTDGGDVSIDNPVLPDVPVYVVAMGSNPDVQDDLLISNIDAPDRVEQGSDFEINAVIAANHGGADKQNSFVDRLGNIKLYLERQVAGQSVKKWEVTEQKDINLRERKVRVKFMVKAIHQTGVIRYRLRLGKVPGEVSTLNNVRQFTVTVSKRTIHVLFYTRRLGWDFNMIRRELAEDPSIALTTMFRVTLAENAGNTGGVVGSERFVVQGSQLAGQQELQNGFPANKKLLDAYKCIIIGSFAANQWRKGQLEALLEYVRGGGSVIFLGGEYSFGRGGYAGTAIEPLFPWRLNAMNLPLLVGRFPVSIAASAGSNGIVANLAPLLDKAGQVYIESINQVGRLKPAAVALLNASVGSRVIAVVAWQHYGQGQCLAVASNTLWRWSRGNVSLKKAYGHFWRQGIRYLAGQSEGGRILAVRWDKEHYQPAEQAVVNVHVAGDYKLGQLHLKAHLKYKNEDMEIPVESSRLNDVLPDNKFVAKLRFNQPGLYRFELTAFKQDKKLETYNKELYVGPILNEGANLQVDVAFLSNLAIQSGGAYFGEKQANRLGDLLRNRLLQHSVTLEVPLVQDKYVFIIILLGILATEWAIRRKMNLF